MTFIQLKKTILALLICLVCSMEAEGAATKSSLKGAVNTVIAARGNTATQTLTRKDPLKPTTKPQPAAPTGTEPKTKADLLAGFKTLDALDQEHGTAAAEFAASQYKDVDNVKTKFKAFEDAHTTAVKSTEEYFKSKEELEQKQKEHDEAFGEQVKETGEDDDETQVTQTVKRAATTGSLKMTLIKK